MPARILSPSQKAVLSAIGRLSSQKVFTYRNIIEENPRDEDGKIYELSSVKKAVIKLKDLGLVELVRNGKPVYFRSKERLGENIFGVYR